MYYIQYITARFFIFLLLLLPEKARFKFGDFLGMVAYKLIKSRRLTAIINLKMAFPEKGDAEIEEIAKKSFKIMIKAFLCSLWFDKYFKDTSNYKIINQKSIFDAYAKGQGVMAATMHMGNMEASTVVTGENEIITVAKKQRNPYINKYITETRSKVVKMEVIEKDEHTSKKLISKLKERKIYALFSDHRDKGAIVNFFGKETKAPSGAVSMALKFGMPLLLVYNVLNDDNTITIYVSDEIQMIKTGNFKEDVQSNVQLLINKMEDIIRENPTQWMWFHDRWNNFREYKSMKKKGSF